MDIDFLVCLKIYIENAYPSTIKKVFPFPFLQKHFILEIELVQVFLCSIKKYLSLCNALLLKNLLIFKFKENKSFLMRYVM